MSILRNTVDANAPDFAQRSHHLVVNMPAEALWVNADSARLEQVFSNLIGNALDPVTGGEELQNRLG